MLQFQTIDGVKMLYLPAERPGLPAQLLDRAAVINQIARKQAVAANMANAQAAQITMLTDALEQMPAPVTTEE
jgi:hypothetical protein